MPDPSRVVAGHKATLANSHVSDEAKAHSKQVLEDEYGIDTNEGHEAKEGSGHVVGGYKATLANPNVSAEAKEHAKEVLENEYHVPVGTTNDKENEPAHSTTPGRDPSRVIGGLKATLHNDNVSDEAKERAQERLEDMGEM